MRGLILWIEALSVTTANDSIMRTTLGQSTIGESIILAQSDTTAGFLCKDSTKLNHIKNRNPNTKILIESPNLATLKTLSRVPNKHKNRIRKMALRKAKTTFVFPNGNAIRLVTQPKQQRVLQIFGALFSSSANTHKANFNREDAIAKSDIIVLDKRDLFENTPSTILKLGRKKIHKLR